MNYSSRVFFTQPFDWWVPSYSFETVACSLASCQQFSESISLNVRVKGCILPFYCQQLCWTNICKIALCYCCNQPTWMLAVESLGCVIVDACTIYLHFLKLFCCKMMESTVYKWRHCHLFSVITKPPTTTPAPAPPTTTTSTPPSVVTTPKSSVPPPVTGKLACKKRAKSNMSCYCYLLLFVDYLILDLNIF